MNNNDIARITIELNKAVKKLPFLIGNKAVKMYKQNFQEEGFFGNKWQDVRRRINSRPGADGKRKILTGRTGQLGRSIQFRVEGLKVVIFSDVPYAKMHNDGGEFTQKIGAYERTLHYKAKGSGKNRKPARVVKQKVKAHTRKIRMPRRRFIGDSPEIRKMIEQTIATALQK